jgi:hypothetical protein
MTLPVAVDLVMVEPLEEPMRPPISTELAPTVTAALLEEFVTWPEMWPARPPPATTVPDEDTAPLAVELEMMPTKPSTLASSPTRPPTRVEFAPTITVELLEELVMMPPEF